MSDHRCCDGLDGLHHEDCPADADDIPKPHVHEPYVGAVYQSTGMIGLACRGCNKRPTIPDSLPIEWPDDEPDCHCLADGQPMTELGVMHKYDCEWLKWFRVPGCMADDLPIEWPDE
jgi:hypothetical protein